MKAKAFPSKRDVLAVVESSDLIIHKSGRSWKDFPGFSYGKRPGAVENAKKVEFHFAELGFTVEHRTPGDISNGQVKFVGRWK